MTAIDRQQIIEDAAKLSFAAHFRNATPDPVELAIERDGLRAVFPVIVAAVLKPIRELHREQFQFCRECDADYPCLTVRLLDQIETDSKGGE